MLITGTDTSAAARKNVLEKSRTVITSCANFSQKVVKACQAAAAFMAHLVHLATQKDLKRWKLQAKRYKS